MRTTRRALSVLAVAGLVFALSPSAQAAETKKAVFEYGTDKASWFWEKQFSQQVGGPDAPGGVTHRQGLPNPQSSDTLPVAVEGGEPEKISSIAFNLTGRGVEAGSTITGFTLTIVEKTDPNEAPQFNAGGKEIRACRVEGFWPAGEAEVWKGQPEHDDKACVTGKRQVPEDGSKPTRWSFDLKSLAEPWGENPAGAHGVILLPVMQGSGPAESWQINLKIPSRDDDVTEEDEYQQTRNRAVVQITFEPPEPVDDTATGTIGGSTTGTTTTSGGGFTPSTTFGGDSGSDIGSTIAAPTTKEPSPEPTEQEQPQAAPVAQQQPQLPGYVWALLPLALLALAAVRNIILEPVASLRPDGVVASIRRLNAQRRGLPVEEAVSDQTGRGGLGKSLARARAWFSKVTRSRT